MRIRISRTLVAALLPALAACAANTPANGPLPSWQEARACRAERGPTTLPAADQLVDAGALGAEAARLWRASGVRGGHVLFTLLYDRDGTNVRRDVIEHSVPHELADSLQKLVFAHRKRTGAARDEWGVRFRVDLGDEPAFAVARREVCTPVPSDRRVAMRGIADAPGSAATTPDLVWVRVRLDATGLVTDARVERGALREGGETRLLTYVRGLAFRPALADGRPVPGETMIPVRLGL